MVQKLHKKKSEKETLRQAVVWEIGNVAGSARDRLTTSRKKLLDYYELNPRGDELDGRSKVISPDCKAMTDATIAQLVDMVSHDHLCEFEAEGPDDEAQATLESKLCNSIVQEVNQGAVELQDAISDALKMGDGVLKFYAEETEETDALPISNADEQARSYMQQAHSTNEYRVLEYDDKKDSGTLYITTTDVKFKLCSVPAERFLYPLNHDGHTLADCHFVAEAMTMTRGQLRAEGFDAAVVNELQAASIDTNEASRKRNKGATDYSTRATPDQEEIEIHECYIHIDLTGDGLSTLQRVLMANRETLLEYEKVDYVPYVLGAALLKGQRLGGQSLVETIMPVQDIKTALWRQRLDNATVANNNRVVYDPNRATEDDILNPMAGGGIRARDPGSVVPLPFYDVGPSLQMGMDYADKVRTELGGASLDMASADAQLVGETAHGIERQMSNRELHIAMMARNLAETLLTPLFLLVHRTLKDFANKPFKAQMKGEWTEINPSEWPDRVRCNIVTGDSMGVRRTKAATLQLCLQMQQMAMQSGMQGVLADAKTAHRTMTDMLKLSGIENPGRYVIDPETPAAQQAAQANAQSAQQQQQQIDRLGMMTAQNEQAKVSADRDKAAAELQFKYAQLSAEMEMKEAELVGGATLEFQKIQNATKLKGNIDDDAQGSTESTSPGVAVN